MNKYFAGQKTIREQPFKKKKKDKIELKIDQKIDVYSESLFMGFPDYTISFWLSAYSTTQSVRKQKELNGFRTQ